MLSKKVLKNSLRKPKIWFVACAAALFAACVSVVVIAFTSDHNKSHSRHFHKRKTAYDHEECSMWVEKFPELMWLVGSEEVKELAVNEIDAIRELYPFDHAIKGLSAVDLFLNGGYPEYLEFVYHQDTESRFSWDQFMDAQLQADLLFDQFPDFSREELVEVINLCLIITEMKASERMREKGWVYGVSLADDEDLHDAILKKHLEIFPSFSSLQLKQKKLIQELFLKVPVNRMFYFSSVYSLIEAFKDMGKNSNDLSLFELICFVHQCRVSGRDAYKDVYGCSGLSLLIFDQLKLFQKSCLVACNSTLEDGFEYYLAKRGELLGFDVITPLNRTMTIVGGLLDCYTKEEGALLKEAFLSLKPEVISYMALEMEKLVTTKDLTYRNLAVLLSNLRNNSKLGRTQENRLANSILVGLPLISKLFFMGNSQKFDLEGPLNFKKVSEIAERDPTFLNSSSFRVRKDGFIQIRR